MPVTRVANSTGKAQGKNSERGPMSELLIIKFLYIIRKKLEVKIFKLQNVACSFRSPVSVGPGAKCPKCPLIGCTVYGP